MYKCTYTGWQREREEVVGPVYKKYIVNVREGAGKSVMTMPIVVVWWVRSWAKACKKRVLLCKLAIRNSMLRKARKKYTYV